MKMKIMLLIGMLIINVNIALAQTGLFEVGTAGKFAVTGIIIVVVIIILREFGKNIFRKK